MTKTKIVIVRTGLTSKPACQMWGTNVNASDINHAYETAISIFTALSIKHFRPYISSIPSLGSIPPVTRGYSALTTEIAFGIARYSHREVPR